MAGVKRDGYRMSALNSDDSRQHAPSERRSVVIVGGGLAGIAAASELGRRGYRVRLVEARPALGGRATSYVDRESGEAIDNCQHVSMGCCTNLMHLCRTLGIAEQFTEERQLHFIAPDGRMTPFRADPLPAPLHLTRSFLRLPYLSFREKRLFASAMRALARSRPESLEGICFANWLREQRQTETLIRHVWEVVLVSALSESLERIDARYARKVFVDGFLSHPHGWRVQIPAVSLDRLYSELARQALERQGVEVLTGRRGTGLVMREGRIHALAFKEGKERTADEFVLAVPHHQVASLVPEELRGSDVIEAIGRIESAPITSVHLWFDRPVTDLPHAVFVGRLSQWLFAREKTVHRFASPDQPESESAVAYPYQVVISASRDLKNRSQSEVIEQVCGELREVWPEAREATLLHSRMITERRAVFSVTPGSDALRPKQQSPVSNLQFAGDWTRTDWPATMEGAVRSGYLAAENILDRDGRPERIVQSGLSVSFLSRWGLGIA